MSSEPPQLVPFAFETDARDNSAVVVMDFSDADAADAHTAAVDWGDGSPAEPLLIDQIDRPESRAPDGPLGTVYGRHAYADAQPRTVVVTLTDSAGRTDHAAFLATFAPGEAEAAGAAFYGPMPQGPTGFESSLGDPTATKVSSLTTRCS